MEDDFNTGGAVGELFETVHALNRASNALAPGDTKGIDDYKRGMVVLKELTQILGLFREPPDAGKPSGDSLTPALLGLLIELRATVRKEKNFKLADEIRNKLGALGVTLEDRPEGTTWRIETTPKGFGEVVALDPTLRVSMPSRTHRVRVSAQRADAERRRRFVPTETVGTSPTGSESPGGLAAMATTSNRSTIATGQAATVGRVVGIDPQGLSGHGLCRGRARSP